MEIVLPRHIQAFQKQ